MTAPPIIDLPTLTADQPGLLGQPSGIAWYTPLRIQALTAACCLASLLFFFAVTAGANQYRHAMKTVGHDAAPSIIAAQHIKAGLADMDADVANELIAPPGHGASTEASYAAHRKEVADNLETAAENVTYGDAERVPIKTILEGLGDYDAFVARAGVFHKRGGDPEVLPSYHDATAEMHATIIPAADALDKANNDMLVQVYNDERAASGRALAVVWVFGILLLGTLIALQLFLARRMRRMVNAPLAVATVVTVGFLILTTAAFQAQSIHLKVAKEDCFDSVYALWHARAVAYDANAAESRWLLDPSHGVESAKGFFDNINLLASFGPNESYQSIADQATNVHVNANQWADQVPADFKGYMADEIRNITFSGEKEAAIEMLRDLGTYVAIDGQIRQLNNTGRHADAVNLCVGDQAGQSDYAFAQFDGALQKVLDINVQSFNNAVDRGDNGLTAFTWLTPAVCIGIAFLALVGVLPRIREYHV